MTEKKNFSRREFLSTTAKTAVATTAIMGAPAINVLGANDKVLLGIIGPGRRGSFLMDQTYRMAARKEKKIEFIAVSDLFPGWRDKGVEKAKEVSAACTGYDNYKKLLENKDVSGVIIATPEHQHAYQTLDAIAAGKHIYVEKPMVHTAEEGKAITKAAEASKCVIQVGTHRRSVEIFIKAKDMIKKGVIGEVTFCEGWWHRNFLPGSKDAAWRYDIPEDASDKNINWKEFLRTGKDTFAKDRPFDKQRYYQWRCYWDYSNGIGSDLMVHQVDALNIVMGTDMPVSAVSSGGIYKWNDNRETPDTWSTVLEYAEGFQLNYHSRFANCNEEEGIRICGTKGTIEILNQHSIFKLIPEAAYVLPKDFKLDPITDQLFPKPVDAHNNAVQAHIENWVDCMKANNQKTNCTARLGYYASAIADMSVQAFKKKKQLYWDKKNEKIVETLA